MRILHTMLRVGNLERSIAFYRDVMGMQLLRTTDRPEQNHTLAFVGLGDEATGAVIELTYNYGVATTISAPASATSRSRFRTPPRRVPPSVRAAAPSRATRARSKAAAR